MSDAEQSQTSIRPTSVQQFWRDVAVQSLSGIIVAVVVYLGAIAFGYLSAPPIRDVVLFLVALSAPGAALAIVNVRWAMGKHTPWWVSTILAVAAVAGLVYSGIMLGQDPNFGTAFDLFPDILE